MINDKTRRGCAKVNRRMLRLLIEFCDQALRSVVGGTGSNSLFLGAANRFPGWGNIWHQKSHRPSTSLNLRHITQIFLTIFNKLKKPHIAISNTHKPIWMISSTAAASKPPALSHPTSRPRKLIIWKMYDHYENSCSSTNMIADREVLRR